MTESASSPLFAAGHVVATPLAIEKLDPVTMGAALQRHMSGDWGDVDADDKAANDADVLNGGRLLSVYRVPGYPDERFWIITEADRSATTFLLPEEY
jgi:hypothetical protein